MNFSKFFDVLRCLTCEIARFLILINLRIMVWQNFPLLATFLLNVNTYWKFIGKSEWLRTVLLVFIRDGFLTYIPEMSVNPRIQKQILDKLVTSFGQKSFEYKNEWPICIQDPNLDILWYLYYLNPNKLHTNFKQQQLL